MFDCPKPIFCYQIHQLSFSPHTDAKGIMDLLKFLSPKHVILVHGEKPKMATLKGRIQSELGIQCYYPANNETVSIPSTQFVKALASDAFIKSCMNPNFKFVKSSSRDGNESASKAKNLMLCLQVTDERVAEGIFVMEKGKKAKVVHQDELLLMLGEKQHIVQHAYCCPIHVKNSESADHTLVNNVLCITDRCFWHRLFFAVLCDEFSDGNVRDFGEHLQVESFHLSICSKDSCPYRITDSAQNKSESLFCCCTWSVEDEKIAWKIISILKNFDLNSVKGLLGADSCINRGTS
ncbi:cleavage and polyadenylation specificity factor subunit 3-II [Morus notabilis]|nr:cleavage and polyadenylation specificity factor subunit 3-II [Morus notabilis]